MSWLFDQPLYIAGIGLVLGALLVVAWSMSGKQALLYVLGLVVFLTVALLIVERYVITDREAIRATLAEIARDVESNDSRKVVKHISASNTELVQKAQNEMPNYQFSECKVTQVHEIEVDADSEPRSARVEFNVLVTGDFKAEGMQLSGSYPRWVRLQMVREPDGRWTVQEYEHAPPQQSIMTNPIGGGADY